jgi:hypothetical protein
VRLAGSTGQIDRGDQGQSSSRQCEKSSSPIRKMFGLLFGMCHSHHAIETRLHEERKVCKKLQKDMKEVKKVLYPNKTPQPGSKEGESNPPTPFEQRYVNYENFDPSQPFAPYASQAFDAPPPPPPEQPRPIALIGGGKLKFGGYLGFGGLLTCG